MRIFKNRVFARFAEQENIADTDLCEAIARAERGLIDADLGGAVIKQRIARLNKGRSGGYRSIIFFRSGEIAFFVFGFAKNKKDNISDDNLKAFKLLAKTYFGQDAAGMQKLIDVGEFTEVKCDEKDL